MLKICGTCIHCKDNNFNMFICAKSDLLVESDYLCDEYEPIETKTENTSTYKVTYSMADKDIGQTLNDGFKKYFRSTNKTHKGSASDATHYQKLQQQPIEIMQTLMTPEQFKGFLWGNVIKYALRCGLKDAPEKEMQKVRQYAEWYIEACEGKTIDPRE